VDSSLVRVLAGIQTKLLSNKRSVPDYNNVLVLMPYSVVVNGTNISKELVAVIFTEV
jgi:hypothetical protein